MHFRRGKYRNEEQTISPSLEAIEAAYDYLLAIPDRAEVSFFRLEDHQKAVAENDQRKGCQYLFYDIFNWLEFFWYTTAYKMRQLTASLVQAYETDSFLPWLVLGRSTIEYAAVTYHFTKKMNKSQLQGPKFAATELKSFEDLMFAYAHGTRFDWPALMAGDRDRLEKKDSSQAPKAVNVLTALSHLSRRDKRYEDVEVAYNMLSDFAHPNMASHSAVIGMPSASGAMHQNEIAVQPGALRGEFIMVVSLPWVSLGVATTVELLAEVHPLMKRWLDCVQYDKDFIIDFTC